VGHAAPHPSPPPQGGRGPESLPLKEVIVRSTVLGLGWGVWVGSRSRLSGRAGYATPHPRPPPQGGREPESLSAKDVIVQSIRRETTSGPLPHKRGRDQKAVRSKALPLIYGWDLAHLRGSPLSLVGRGPPDWRRRSIEIRSRSEPSRNGEVSVAGGSRTSRRRFRNL
jgi:hypothetical protein